MFLTARLALIAAMACSAPAAAQQVIADVGFERPEAVRYDAAEDRYIVSNLGSAGGQNDGFLSLLSPDGQVTTLKWIAGGANGVTLDDPLGLFIAGEEIHVADRKAIHVFDRRSGAPLRSIAVPQAQRLNDLFVSPAGDTFVTDTGSDAVPGALFRVGPGGNVEVFAEPSIDLHRPNGIAMTADGLVVHGGMASDLLTFRDAATGAVVRQTRLPTGRVDGIVPLADGSLLVASQEGHNVYHLTAAGEAHEVAAGVEVPAAIGYDTRRSRVLIPQIAAATITIVDFGAE
jgi:hypothetical protein